MNNKTKNNQEISKYREVGRKDKLEGILDIINYYNIQIWEFCNRNKSQDEDFPTAPSLYNWAEGKNDARYSKLIKLAKAFSRETGDNITVADLDEFNPQEK